jgi:hypothetical protein
MSELQFNPSYLWRLKPWAALHLTVVASNQPEQPNPTINCLRKTAESFIDPTTNLKVEIDGQSIPDVKSNFREQSIAFDFTLPTDNLLTAIGEGPLLGPN